MNNETRKFLERLLEELEACRRILRGEPIEKGGSENG